MSKVNSSFFLLSLVLSLNSFSYSYPGPGECIESVFSFSQSCPWSLVTIDERLIFDNQTCTLTFCNDPPVGLIRFEMEQQDTEGQSSITTIKMSVPASWDFDRDGNLDALTDGLLFIRYNFDLRGESLTDNATSLSSSLSISEIEWNLESFLASVGSRPFGDIDGSNSVDSLTDGLLLIRYLFGVRGETLIDSAIASRARRTTPAEIEAYIEDL